MRLSLAASLSAVSLSAALLFGAASASAQTAAQPAAPAAPVAHVDARERVPAALLGFWKADVAASTYSGAAPREQLRLFSYTADAKVLVTFINTNAAGVTSSGHWAAQVDGSEALEYHSSAGSIAYNVVTLTKVDERNLNLTVGRAGVEDMKGSYALSEDGQTLTYTYQYGSGPVVTILYRKYVAS